MVDGDKTQDANSPHDLVIIGGGPAALAAGIYTTREDIETLILEKGVVGGLAAITYSIENYPGFPEGVGGMELSERFRKQAERFGAKLEYGDVTKIEDGPEVKKVITADKQYQTKAILIATGNDYRKAGVKGEEEYHGKGVHYCATCDGPLYKGRRLAVIGGGNSAAQESLFLARLAEHIDILIRGDKWKASDVLIDRINAAKNMTAHFNTVAEEIVGSEQGIVNKVITKNNQAGETQELAVEGVFVFVGLVPNTKFLEGSRVELDERGFVKTNQRLGTNLVGIFCAGDVRSGATEQIASAVGEGAAAALAIREYLDQVPARKHKRPPAPIQAA
ncbi:FAD-dependent oxidoreductase [Candidatus Microgenomates bacterium]|nr:FAD-dependent oxidoreductase [Candidatus Microgenomates bacterium]